MWRVCSCTWTVVCSGLHVYHGYAGKTGNVGRCVFGDEDVNNCLYLTTCWPDSSRVVTADPGVSRFRLRYPCYNIKGHQTWAMRAFSLSYFIFLHNLVCMPPVLCHFAPFIRLSIHFFGQKLPHKLLGMMMRIKEALLSVSLPFLWPWVLELV